MYLKIGKKFTLPPSLAQQTTAVLGIRGSGKTVTSSVIVEELLDHHHQVCIIDPTDVWFGLKSSEDGKKPGYPVLILGGDHGDLPLAETDGATVARFVVEERASVIISLRHLRKAAQRRFVTDFCEQLYHLKGKAENRNSLLLVIDECDLYVPQRVGGAEARMVGAVEDLVRRGRAAGIGVLLISQRAASINKDVLSVAPWMRTPIWRGYKGKCLMSMEELWRQASEHRPIQFENDGHVEFIELPDLNAYKSLSWYSGHGFWAPIKRVIRHRYTGKLIRLQQKWGEVVVTPNHSVYSADGALAMPQDNPELLAIRHINQQKTREKDSVILKLDGNFSVQDGWIQPRKITRRLTGKLRSSLRGETLHAFMRFLGAWISEGSVHTIGDAIDVSNQDVSWLRSIQDDVSKFSSTTGGVIESSTKGTWMFHLGNKTLGAWLRKYGGHNSASKRIPDFVYNLKWEYVESMLVAMIKGDGSRFKRGNWRYYTKSSELAQGVGFLLTLHAKGYTIGRDKNTGVYRVLQTDWYNNRDQTNQVIEYIDHDGYVYDIEMCGRYAANFTIGVGNVVVHNTQLETLVAHRHTSPQDRKALLEWVKAHDSDSKQEMFMTSLASLVQGEAWFWSPLLDIFSRVQVRNRHTFDSSATPKPGKTMAPRKTAVIDIEKWRSRLGEIIERKKAEDPQALKARISELESQLRKQSASPPAVDHSLALRKAEQAMSHIVERSRASLISGRNLLSEQVIPILNEALRAMSRPISTHSAQPAGARKHSDAAVRPSVSIIPPRSRSESPPEDRKLDKCARAIYGFLTANASSEWTKEQIALMTGYSHSSGSFSNAMSALRTRNLIKEAGGKYSGIVAEAFLDGVERLVFSVDNIVEKLGKCEREIFHIAREANWDIISKEELAELTPSRYSATSGSFDNSISRLCTLGILERVPGGRVSRTKHFQELLQ